MGETNTCLCNNPPHSSKLLQLSPPLRSHHLRVAVEAMTEETAVEAEEAEAQEMGSLHRGRLAAPVDLREADHRKVSLLNLPMDLLDLPVRQVAAGEEAHIRTAETAEGIITTLTTDPSPPICTLLEAHLTFRKL